MATLLLLLLNHDLAHNHLFRGSQDKGKKRCEGKGGRAGLPHCLMFAQFWQSYTSVSKCEQGYTNLWCKKSTEISVQKIKTFRPKIFF